ncbi:hypothetical protein K502DRAFT_350293 [Neoconidiobolus thromboides FSU 785]|nr:hypothetical protein K502DRAFT_350293 [Neoconidiobolus thromboides FSU 785]
MKFQLRLYSTIVNCIVSLILFYNGFFVFNTYEDIGNTPEVVLKIIRCVFAIIVVVSEIPKLQLYYVTYLQVFMVPIGRGLIYFMFAILCFSQQSWGITSLFLLIIFGILTFLFSRKLNYDTSPYIPIDESKPSEINDDVSLPVYTPNESVRSDRDLHSASNTVVYPFNDPLNQTYFAQGSSTFEQPPAQPVVMEKKVKF